MKKFLSKVIETIIAKKLPPDFDEVTTEIIRTVRPFTLTSSERIFALCEAVKYIAANHIPGHVVECGVWRGGSMMAVAQMLVHLNEYDRELYLFDTFEGMNSPGDKDVDFLGISAWKHLNKSDKKDSKSAWCYASLEDVKASVLSTQYDHKKIHFVRGRVEETIPEQAPNVIALLRLDTDWYESTKHELIHLFPRISPGGVIIIDDYGHWQGARQAVDEYIKENGIKILLNRIDYTGRIGVVY